MRLPTTDLNNYEVTVDVMPSQTSPVAVKALYLFSAVGNEKRMGRKREKGTGVE